MFWGLIMEPGRCYTQKVKVSFHVSMAALDVSNSNEDPAQVMCVFEGRNYLLCTLKKKDMVQCPLDLNFEAGSKVSFATNGKAHVHLTGYLTNFEDDEELGEGLEEEEEEEEEAVVKKDKKRGKKEASEGPPTKKSKTVTNNLTLDQTAEEESDDSDFDISKLIQEEAEDDEESGEEEGEEEEDEDEDEDDDEDEEEEDEEASSLSGEEVEEEEESEEEKEVKPKQNGIAKTPQKKAKDQKAVEKTPKEKPKKQEDKKEKPQKQKKAVLKGGVVVQDIKEGTGEPVKEGKFVHVYYEGRLKDNNKMFDSTTKGPGFSFRVGKGEVIKGWDIGLVGMKVGGKRRITCPPKVAYGPQGSLPVIPPNSTLIFDVEVKKIS